MRDRRFDDRRELREPVEVHWADSNAQLHANGELCDLSSSGARLRLERPIRLTTLVDLKRQDRELRGKVRYCTRSEAGFLVGIEFLVP